MNECERDVKCFEVRAQCFPTYRPAICSPRPLLASNLACNAFAATGNRIWAVWWENAKRRHSLGDLIVDGKVRECGLPVNATVNLALVNMFGTAHLELR